MNTKRFASYLSVGVLAAALAASIGLTRATAQPPAAAKPDEISMCIGYLALVTSDTSSNVTKLVGLYREATGADEAGAMAARDKTKAAMITLLKSGEWNVDGIESGVWDCYQKFGTDVPTESQMEERVRLSAGLPDAREPPPQSQYNYVSADGNSVGYNSANDPSLQSSSSSSSSSGIAAPSRAQICDQIVDRYVAIGENWERAAKREDLDPLGALEGSVRACQGTWSVLDDLRRNGCPDISEEASLRRVINMYMDKAFSLRDDYFPDYPISCNRAPPA